MRLSLKGVAAGIVLSVALLFLATVASAGPKEDVAAATLKWAQALGEDDPDKVLSFYSDDAVLWGNAVTDRSRRSCGLAGLICDGLQGSAGP